MPRDSGTGVATPPSGTTLVANTDIQSAPLNSIHSDIYAILNAPIPAGLLPSLSFLPLSGGTITGPMTLSADATASLNPVTLQQYTAGLAGKAALVHTHTSTDITNFNAASDARIALQTIAGHSDTVIGTLANNDVLTWETATSKWKNKPANQFTDYDKGALAQNTTYTQAHGLGARPSRVDVYVENVTAELGYTPGQRIPIDDVSNIPIATTLIIDATNVVLLTRVTVSFTVLDVPTRSDNVITNARWKVIFRVFA